MHSVHSVHIYIQYTHLWAQHLSKLIPILWLFLFKFYCVHFAHARTHTWTMHTQQALNAFNKTHKFMMRLFILCFSFLEIRIESSSIFFLCLFCQCKYIVHHKIKSKLIDFVGFVRTMQFYTSDKNLSRLGIWLQNRSLCFLFILSRLSHQYSNGARVTDIYIRKSAKNRN